MTLFRGQPLQMYDGNLDHISFQFKCREAVITDHKMTKIYQEKLKAVLKVLVLVSFPSHCVSATTGNVSSAC